MQLLLIFSGMHVTKLVGIMFVLVFFLDLLAACSYSGAFSGFIYTVLVVGIIAILLIISRQPQNRLTFKRYSANDFFSHNSFFILFIQICIGIFDTWTPIHTSYCNHSEHLLDLQIEHIDIGAIYRMDDTWFDNVFLLWHNA